MSDLLGRIIWIPREIKKALYKLWVISGPLGQALCKLVVSPKNAFVLVCTFQSLVLITVDRIDAVVFPLRSPLINSKLYPFFTLATWIVAIAINS